MRDSFQEGTRTVSDTEREAVPSWKVIVDAYLVTSGK